VGGTIECGGEINPDIYPGAYDMAMAVGATTESDNRAYFSEYRPYVEVAAPGFNIYSTYISDGYALLNGTSMASPYVAGLAALIWSVDPSVSRDKVRSIIQLSTDDLGAAGKDDHFGYGRINAGKALLQIWSIGLQNVYGQTVEDTVVSFLTDDNQAPIPAVYPIIVTSNSPNGINWSVTTSPDVPWLQIAPATSGITSSSTPGQFNLTTTRPDSYGVYTTTITVTGTSVTGKVLGTAKLTVRIGYQAELYKTFVPFTAK
jgi:subtilisin family serine protease